MEAAAPHGWRLQRPARPAVERDEQAIARWWPRTGLRICRNARRRRAVIVFWDESGASLLPITRRSWAPLGNIPVIRHHFNWKRCSMAAAICYGSHGGGAEVAFHHQHGVYDTDALIGALEELRRFLGGQKETLVWDGLPAHRSLAMAAWLRAPPLCRSRPWSARANDPTLRSLVRRIG